MGCQSTIRIVVRCLFFIEGARKTLPKCLLCCLVEIVSLGCVTIGSTGVRVLVPYFFPECIGVFSKRADLVKEHILLHFLCVLMYDRFSFKLQAVYIQDYLQYLYHHEDLQEFKLWSLFKRVSQDVDGSLLASQNSVEDSCR